MNTNKALIDLCTLCVIYGRPQVPTRIHSSTSAGKFCRKCYDAWYRSTPEYKRRKAIARHAQRQVFEHALAGVAKALPEFGHKPAKSLKMGNDRTCPLHPSRYGKNYGHCNTCFDKIILHRLAMQSYRCPCGAPLNLNTAGEIGINVCKANGWHYRERRLWALNIGQSGTIENLACLNCLPPETSHVKV